MYGLSGCSRQRSTNSLRLSLVTSNSSMLLVSTRGIGRSGVFGFDIVTVCSTCCCCCVAGFFTNQRCSLQCVADIRLLKDWTAPSWGWSRIARNLFRMFCVSLSLLLFYSFSLSLSFSLLHRHIYMCVYIYVCRIFACFLLSRERATLYRFSTMEANGLIAMMRWKRGEHVWSYRTCFLEWNSKIRSQTDVSRSRNYMYDGFPLPWPLLNAFFRSSRSNGCWDCSWTHGARE